MDVTAEEKGAVALANIFCWAVSHYHQMGAKSVVISPHLECARRLRF